MREVIRNLAICIAVLVAAAIILAEVERNQCKTVPVPFQSTVDETIETIYPSMGQD